MYLTLLSPLDDLIVLYHPLRKRKHGLGILSGNVKKVWLFLCTLEHGLCFRAEGYFIIVLRVFRRGTTFVEDAKRTSYYNPAAASA